MTKNEFIKKYGSEKDITDLLGNAEKVGIDEFSALIKEKFPEFGDNDILDLYNDIAKFELDLDELENAAGGLRWQKHFPDPAAQRSK